MRASQRQREPSAAAAMRTPKKLVKMQVPGTSLAVQWLRLCASTAGGVGSFPRPGTKIPHAKTKTKTKMQVPGPCPQGFLCGTALAHVFYFHFIYLS